MSYLEWNRSDTDRVVVRRRGEGETWAEPIELADGCFEHYVSALAPRGHDVLVVWVDEVNRAAIFDAMLARCTFGASDEIVMRISAVDTSVEPAREHAVGSQFRAKAASPVRLKIDVQAPDGRRLICETGAA